MFSNKDLQGITILILLQVHYKNHKRCFVANDNKHFHCHNFQRREKQNEKKLQACFLKLVKHSSYTLIEVRFENIL